VSPILAGSFGSQNPNVIYIIGFFAGQFEVTNVTATNNSFSGV
jgi:hypothetical protein